MKKPMTVTADTPREAIPSSFIISGTVGTANQPHYRPPHAVIRDVDGVAAEVCMAYPPDGHMRTATDPYSLHGGKEPTIAVLTTLAKEWGAQTVEVLPTGLGHLEDYIDDVQASLDENNPGEGMKAESLSPFDFLDHWLTWNGIQGYSRDVWNLVRALHGMPEKS